jgi:cellulose synthase (UDP-forming)
MIEGIKSPFDLAGNRSIVIIHLKDANSFEPFMASFLEVQQSSQISGSVAVLHGSQFQSFRIGSEVYHVGVLPWWPWLTLLFTEYPLLIVLIVFVLVLLLAVWIRQWLRIKARTRLNMLED